ncbi:hypothetical protein [Rhizobium alvei]|uniref:Uncharacterized protein n=2 Tax=Rhizobium alvei TaxID=1132659 RepID=A0ABT8YUD9_9HYPH|nr:hypothetical protein [Rhizobium alvei]MDO6966977.1 hypothetical protein [Rhizobium alvei]
MTIRMIRHDDGKTGDIHPDEVENMKKFGWVVDDAAEQDDISLSDTELRDAIEKATGVRPHHKTGRDKLLKAYSELNAQEA